MKWDDIWNKRSEILDLRLLTCTGVYLELKKERTENLMMQASGIDVERHSIVFNTWPYTLEEQDRKELAEILIEINGAQRYSSSHWHLTC